MTSSALYRHLCLTRALKRISMTRDSNAFLPVRCTLVFVMPNQKKIVLFHLIVTFINCSLLTSLSLHSSQLKVIITDISNQVSFFLPWLFPNFFSLVLLCPCILVHLYPCLPPFLSALSSSCLLHSFHSLFTCCSWGKTLKLNSCYWLTGIDHQSLITKCQ